MTPYATEPGNRFPFGATPDGRGVNFSIFSRHARGVELRLFESAGAREPLQVVALDPDVHRTFFSWHVFVVGLKAGTHYAWRVDGRDFDLLDPFARAVTTRLWDREVARGRDRPGSCAMRAVVAADGGYDWEGDRPLDRRPIEDAVIYELHVGAFTRHPSSGVARPGTFAGLIEKIPYLRELGVTDVELLPIMAFDEQDLPPAAAARGLKNLWGYSPCGFFAPHPGYCLEPERGSGLREFRDLVKALHRAGIGVILDVVFNHTAEAGLDGPAIHFKALGDETFYLVDPTDPRRYRDYTGCGNTINCNHPLVARYIVLCLEWWVREMHVDGFRFDLASVLARGEDGALMHHAPLPWAIEFSPALANTRLIAEAWDAGGLYLVGGFPGFRWAEWNGRYRDVIRRFLRGDGGIVGEVATRVAGSSDLYAGQGRLPSNSINFVTCHDGFTLRDLVTYERKRNAANGQDGTDGSDDNVGWNCGVEGETDDPRVRELRARQTKNAMAILLLSQGVPMLLAGDEALRTQGGNNNAYCQDNETSWIDWRLCGENAGMIRFVRGLIALRKRHRSLRRARFLTGRPPRGNGDGNGRGAPDIAWHGRRLGEPLWNDPEAALLAFTLAAVEDGEEDLHVILNMADRSEEGLALPAAPGGGGRSWRRAVDTARASPEDVLEPADQPAVGPGAAVTAAPRSVLVFEARS